MSATHFLTTTTRNRRRARIRTRSLQECVFDQLPPPEELVELSFLRDALSRVLANLSDERRDVLSLLYGLPQGEGRFSISYTIDEIARIRKISRERVAAIRATTLIRLRSNRQSRRLLSPYRYLVER